jgi:hypothetical protein
MVMIQYIFYIFWPFLLPVMLELKLVFSIPVMLSDLKLFTNFVNFLSTCGGIGDGIWETSIFDELTSPVSMNQVILYAKEERRKREG